MPSRATARGGNDRERKVIVQVSGDLILSRAAAIAHGVGPNDNFASGLALALREQWPAMYKDFRHFCQTTHPKPGGLWTWAGAGGQRIVNLFTQEEAPRHGGHPGKASLDHVNHALRELRKLVEHEGIASIALPRLATGVGALDWKDVQPLIERHLGELPARVIVYSTFHKGMAADEGLG